LKYIVFVLLFASALLNAENLYINVAKLSKKSDLEYVGLQFKRVGISAIYKHDGLDYVLFSGPYADEEHARYALEKINKYFPSAEIVRVKRKTDTKRTITKKRVSKRKILTANLMNGQWYKGAFVGLDLSYNNVLATHKVETGSVLATLPKEGSTGFTLDAGYEFANGFSFLLAYSQMTNQDISLSAQYLSIQYQFETSTDFYPYFGLLAGISSAKWNLVPLQNVTYIDDKSSSSLSGIESGIIYPVDEYKMSLYLGYTVLIMNHTAVLEADTGNSQLSFKRLDNILFGVRYHF
jgi:hypothetical protein